MRIITVTDETGTSGQVTAPASEAVDAIRPWFPDAPQEITDSLDDLDNALRTGRPTHALEAFLGISIRTADNIRELRYAGADYAAARTAMADATEVLRAAVTAAAAVGVPETQIARHAGVTRTTVRAWLGK